MKKVYFMKIAPYNLFKKGLSKFESIKLLTTHKYNPGIEKNKIKDKIGEAKFLDVGIIFASKLKRSKETLKFLITNKLVRKDVKIIFTKLLNEIKFSINSFCTKEEYDKQGSTVIRKIFIKNFLADKLDESKESIKARLDKLKELIKENSDKNILIISHTFLIKLYQIYMKNKDLFENSEILKSCLNPAKKIMDFCSVIKYPNFFKYTLTIKSKKKIK